MGLDPPPAHLPLAVLDRLDGDTAALIRQTTETAHAIDALAQCKTEAELRQRQAALETRLSTALAAAQAVQNAYPSVVSLMEKLPPEELVRFMPFSELCLLYLILFLSLSLSWVPVALTRPYSRRLA